MQYQKLVSGETIIEFHNNWLGEEFVIINGQLVSKKSSIWGTQHHFAVIEKGHQARYVLTTKVGANMQIMIDLSRNGEVLYEDVVLKFGTEPKTPPNTFKKSGIVKLKEFEIDEALEDFHKALDANNKDPEIYFHMACAYSIQEKTELGFESLKIAVKHHLPNTEIILQHDMLAFLRINDAFEDFLTSNFTEYNKALLDGDDEAEKSF